MYTGSYNLCTQAVTANVHGQLQLLYTVHRQCQTGRQLRTIEQLQVMWQEALLQEWTGGQKRIIELGGVERDEEGKVPPPYYTTIAMSKPAQNDASALHHRSVFHQNSLNTHLNTLVFSQKGLNALFNDRMIFQNSLSNTFSDRLLTNCSPVFEWSGFKQCLFYHF